jgi:hypothetical protein
MMLPLDASKWPVGSKICHDKGTSTHPDRQKGRKLPDLPVSEAQHIQNHMSTVNKVVSPIKPISPDTEEDGGDESKESVVRRPNKLHQIKNVYAVVDAINDDSDDSCKNRLSRESDKSINLSILSPFDEQEEWSKISQIINSFGADIGNKTSVQKEGSTNTPDNSPIYDYISCKRRKTLSSTVEEWLKYINMDKYAAAFLENGYDNMNFLGGGFITKEDLHNMGINDQADCSTLFESLKEHSHSYQMTDAGSPSVPVRELPLDQWLNSIQLPQYRDNFTSNLFTDMDRISVIWVEELNSIVFSSSLPLSISKFTILNL